MFPTVRASWQVACVWTLFLSLAVAATAEAAGKPTGETPNGSQTVSVSAAIQKVSSEKSYVGATFDDGYKVLQMSGDGDIVGELSFNHYNGATVTTVMGGFRAAESVSPKAKLYGQFLVGLLHDVGTDFAAQPGVGLDWDINPSFDLRIRLDFPIDMFDGGHQTGTRFGVGLAFPIEKK